MRLNDEVAENRLLTRWADLMPRSPRQVGGVHETDAELVPLGDGRLLALTVDTVAEEVRLGLYRDPRTAGRVAVAASLSDLAAVGAEPLGLLLSVTLPPGDGAARVQEGVALGAGEAARAAATWVLGGDTNDGPDLAVACTAAGLVPEGESLGRLGLSPGDHLFASGPLGLGAAVAASALFGGSGPGEADFSPAPRIRHGVALRRVASAAIDTSDGLVAALDQLARLNGVALRVTRPPGELLEPRAAEAALSAGLAPLALLAALHGEFELLFGVPPGRLAGLARAAGALSWEPVPLGRVEEGSGVLFGAARFDSGRARNLLAESGGGLGAYARALGALASLVPAYQE